MILRYSRAIQNTSKSTICYNMVMEKMKTRLRRFFYTAKHDWFRFENVILVVAIIFCLGWTYGAIMSMSRNWELSQTLETKRFELAVVKLEVESLELENQYYKSEEYQELAARAKMNKKNPGETMIYLSDNSDYAKTKHKTVTTTKKPEKSNFAEWITFLFGT